MSFENKGFPNDLDSRYNELNQQYSYYNEPETMVNSAGQLIRISSGSGSGPVGAVLPEIKLPGLKYKNFQSYGEDIGGKVKIGNQWISVSERNKLAVPQSVTSYQTPTTITGSVKKEKTAIGEFLQSIFGGDKEKRKARKERRKQRRYKRKGNRLVKLNSDGTETDVINPAEKLQAVQEINTPSERLPESAMVNAPIDIDQPDFIKTDLEGVTITATKKSNSMKYLTIGIIALILVVIAYKLIKKK